MSGFKDPDYLERKSAGNDARKAALEKFRARAGAPADVTKPTVPAKAPAAAPAGKPAAPKSAKHKGK
jgi:hypothetical protein